MIHRRGLDGQPQRDQAARNDGSGARTSRYPVTFRNGAGRLGGATHRLISDAPAQRKVRPSQQDHPSLGVATRSGAPGLYVLDVLGLTVLVRVRDRDTFVHIDGDGMGEIQRKPVAVEVFHGGENDYGQSWVYCEECGAILQREGECLDGDGYDGLCGNCADRAEAAGRRTAGIQNLRPGDSSAKSAALAREVWCAAHIGADTTPTGSQAMPRSTRPGAGGAAPASRYRRWAVAQAPAHHDEPWSPLVAVLASLRITPPIGTNHRHQVIRTHVLNVNWWAG